MAKINIDFDGAAQVTNAIKENDNILSFEIYSEDNTAVTCGEINKIFDTLIKSDNIRTNAMKRWKCFMNKYVSDICELDSESSNKFKG